MAQSEDKNIAARSKKFGDHEPDMSDMPVTLKDLTIGIHAVTLSVILSGIQSVLPDEYDDSQLSSFLHIVSRYMKDKTESGTLFSAAKALAKAIKSYPVDEDLKKIALDSIADFQKLRKL